MPPYVGLPVLGRPETSGGKRQQRPRECPREPWVCWSVEIRTTYSASCASLQFFVANWAPLLPTTGMFCSPLASCLNVPTIVHSVVGSCLSLRYFGWVSHTEGSQGWIPRYWRNIGTFYLVQPCICRARNMNDSKLFAPIFWRPAPSQPGRVKGR